MKTVVCRLDLGYTRIAGYLLYDDQTEEFYETTPREVKELTRNNKVNGLKLVNDEIELDEEGFNQRNLMIRTGVGKYRLLKDSSSLINRMYTVIDVVECGGEFKYEVITNYCGRKLVDEDFIKSISFMGYVAGMIITDGGKIKLLNKKFEGTEKILTDKDIEYKEIEEISEAKTIPSIDEEIKLVKDDFKKKETLIEDSKINEKVTEVTNIREGTVDKTDIEPEKLEFNSSEVEMAEVKEEVNVEQTVENENKTEDDVVQTSDDQDKAEEKIPVTPKKKSKAKK